MNLVESIRMSVRALRGHPLRTLLTTLGIVIRVAAVIAFVSLGASLQSAVIGEVAGEKSPAMVATIGPPGDGPSISARGSQPTFTEYDVDTIDSMDGVAAVVPRGPVPLSGMTHNNQTLGFGTLTSTKPTMFSAGDRITFVAGESFTLGSREVVVNEAAAVLFDAELSVGSTLTLHPPGDGPVEVTVVGIVQSDDYFRENAPEIYAPVDPFYEVRLESRHTGEMLRTYPTLVVFASSYERVEPVREDVKRYLKGDADAQALKPQTYAVSVQAVTDLIDLIQEIIELFTGFITGVAVLSLIVGAIGIANMMLVSVTERTREIGIMKAVGARNRDILQMFLVEATILGLVGAIIGTALGAVAAWVGAQYMGLPFTFPLEYVGLAVVVGICVGVLAGLYPAWNAARTDPIHALRHE